MNITLNNIQITYTILFDSHYNPIMNMRKKLLFSGFLHMPSLLHETHFALIHTWLFPPFLSSFTLTYSGPSLDYPNKIVSWFPIALSPFDKMWLFIVFLHLDINSLQVEIYFVCCISQVPKKYLAHIRCLINKQLSAWCTFHKQRTGGLRDVTNTAHLRSSRLSSEWRMLTSHSIFSGPLPRYCANLTYTIDFTA